MISATEALKHYNSHYKNASYQAVQVTLVRDLTNAYQASEPKLLEIALRTEPIRGILNLLTDIHAAAQLASVLHSVAGNAAHELLCATDVLLQLTNLLLKGESSESYKLEKLQKAERYLAYAKEHLVVPASKTFAPYKTLLLSADKSYPSMSLGMKPMAVCWFLGTNGAMPVRT